MSFELLTAIDRLVEEKTFNLDALEAIKALRDQAASLEKARSELADLCDKYCGEIKRLSEDNRELSGQIESLTSAVALYKAREKQADEAIFGAEKHKAVAEAYKDAMEIVFRPHAVRERVHQNIPVPLTAQGGGSWVQNHQQTSDVIKEDV